MNPEIAKLTCTSLESIRNWCKGVKDNWTELGEPINVYNYRAVNYVTTNQTFLGIKNESLIRNMGTTICYVNQWPVLPGEQYTLKSENDVNINNKPVIISFDDPADANNDVRYMEKYLQDYKVLTKK